MTERYLGPMSPPYEVLRDFLLETPDALERVIRTYFLAEPEDPHEHPDSDIISALAEWFDRHGDDRWALALHVAAVHQAVHAARQDEPTEGDPDETD